MTRDNTVDSAETQRLLASAVAGDPSSLTELLNRHRAPLRQMISLRLDARLRQRVDESDVIQETFFEVQRRLADFWARRPMPFGLWLKQTARQHLLRLYRQHARAGRRSVLREQPLGDDSSQLLAEVFARRQVTPSELAARVEFQARIRAAIMRLPRLDHEILIMRHLEGLSHRDIGQLLNISEANARQRYGRALVKLRVELDRAGLGDSADGS